MFQLQLSHIKKLNEALARVPLLLSSFNFPVHNSVKRGSGITVPVFHHLWIDINLLKSKTV